MTVLSMVDAHDDQKHSAIRAGLGRCGAVVIHNFSPVEFHRTMCSLGRVYAHPHADRRGVTIVRPTPNAPFTERGLSHNALAPHTDRAQVDLPPGIVGLLCVRGATSGGRSTLVDIGTVLRRLAPSMSVSELSRVLRIRVDYSGKLLPMLWMDEHGGFFVRYRDDDTAHPSSRDPYILARLRAMMAECRQEVLLAPGDGYIISNRRWLHGRAEFLGDRMMSRILLADLYDGTINLGIDPASMQANDEPADVRA